MNELNAIFQNYPGYFPCLEAIESDRNIFKIIAQVIYIYN